jgi:transcriptional regulator with XRE-family HTH domain
VAEGKGLLLPNVESIQELLRLRRWDASILASHAEVDLRTIGSVLRGDQKQWAVMEKIANALNVPLSQIVKGIKKEDEDAWPAYCGIQVYKDWEPSWRAIETAQESLLIIDSIFSNERGRLGTALSKNTAWRSKSLKVSIYMASPKRPFGAQRAREMDGQAKELLCRKTTLREENHYRITFRNLVAGIRLDTEIPLFEYVCMPSLRIVRVDQVHLYWGWFPLAARNPHHICLYVRGGGPNSADNELCDRLGEHIQKVIERSTLVK